MINEISEYLSKYVALGEDEKQILSAWALSTWAFDPKKTPTTAYVYLHSLEKQCGKSTTLKVLKTVAFNAVKADSVTPAALFGLIEGEGDRVGAPSILIDEVDSIFYGRSNQELRGLINSGYSIGGNVLRSRGGHTKEYSTYCPKILAGIHNGSALPDTISDRCIPITLVRKPVEMELEYFMEYTIKEEILALQDRIDAWVTENISEIEGYRFRRVEGLSDRQSEVCWPLLAIGYASGVDLTEPLRRTFAKYEISSFNADREFLLQIKEAIEVFGTRGKLSSSELLEALEMPATAKGASLLATRLEGYKVESKNIRIGNQVMRGFELNQFKHAFEDNGVE